MVCLVQKCVILGCVVILFWHWVNFIRIKIWIVGFKRRHACSKFEKTLHRCAYLLLKTHFMYKLNLILCLKGHFHLLHQKPKLLFELKHLIFVQIKHYLRRLLIIVFFRLTIKLYFTIDNLLLIKSLPLKLLYIFKLMFDILNWWHYIIIFDGIILTDLHHLIDCVLSMRHDLLLLSKDLALILYPFHQLRVLGFQQKYTSLIASFVHLLGF